MPAIQVNLNKEENALIRAAAKLQGRSKTAQFRHGALEHARTVLSKREGKGAKP